MIKKFNGNLEELRELILNSWHRKYEGKFFYDYTVPFLDWNLNRPNKEPRLQVGAYRNNKLTGFLCGIPVDMLMKGEKSRHTLTTFFSVHQDYKGFTAYKLVKEFTGKTPIYGYNTNIYYIDGQAELSEKVIISNFVRDNIAYTVGGRSYFLMKILNYDRAGKFYPIPYFTRRNMEHFDKRIYKPAAMGKTRYYDEVKDIAGCMRLLNSYSKKLEFARLWTEKELSWQLYYPEVSYSLVYEVKGEIKGVLNYYLSPIIKGTVQDILAKIDHIYFADMTFKERKKFLIESIEKIKEKHDPVAITLFYMPYFYPDLKYSEALEGEEFDDDLFASLNFHPDDDCIKVYFVIYDRKNYNNLFPFYLDYK